MSLINDLLCDLQERKAPANAAANLADLQPVRRSQVARRRWLLAPAAIAFLASSAWAIRYVEEPRPVVAQTVAAPDPDAGRAEDPVMSKQRDQRLASLLDFSVSLRKLPAREPAARKAPAPVTVDEATTPAPVARVRPAKPVRVDAPAEPAPAIGEARQAAYARPAKIVVSDPRREGLAALAAGRAAAAEVQFRLLVAREPGDAQARLYLGRALEAQGRDADAEGAFSEALVAVSEPAPVARTLARRLLHRGATREALRLLEAYRPDGPLDPEHDAFIAAVQQRLGHHDIAAERYRGVLAVRPQAAAWWVGLAISEEARGDGAGALDAYRNARNIGNLDARLAEYTDQRIAAMQGTDQS